MTPNEHATYNLGIVYAADVAQIAAFTIEICALVLCGRQPADKWLSSTTYLMPVFRSLLKTGTASASTF